MSFTETWNFEKVLFEQEIGKIGIVGRWKKVWSFIEYFHRVLHFQGVKWEKSCRNYWQDGNVHERFEQLADWEGLRQKD